MRISVAAEHPVAPAYTNGRITRFATAAKNSNWGFAALLRLSCSDSMQEVSPVFDNQFYLVLTPLRLSISMSAAEGSERSRRLDDRKRMRRANRHNNKAVSTQT
jgi:hypothetical protein